MAELEAAPKRPVKNLPGVRAALPVTFFVAAPLALCVAAGLLLLRGEAAKVANAAKAASNEPTALTNEKLSRVMIPPEAAGLG